eukprot:TRINITY_DN11206_c0_g1_i1.p1 TRINITY_DN11206_c0_g1~~TRINITY_DN11206_c0_g1_i1.p1  ORF type:complete len:315 (-),score=31.95 TRINITY_DN11206_c0_g1_i1:85-1029(-)
MAEESESVSSSLVQSKENFLAGTVAGIMGLTVGYPWDTVKVRLQTQTSGQTSAFQIFRATIKKEGFLALYSGILSPVIGEAFIQSVVFGSYGALQRLILSSKPASESQSVHTLTLTDLLIAGGGSGLTASVIVCPVELVKSKMQAQGAAAALKTLKYKSTIDCVLQIVRGNGIGGLFKGQLVTTLREIPSYAAYFWSYELCRRIWMKTVQKSESVDDINVVGQLLAGGIAGMACWVCSYPLDTIKTRLQTQIMKNTGQSSYTGIIDCARRSWLEGGPRVFFKGLSPCLQRAFVVNAVIFYAYEVSLTFFQKTFS